MSSSFITQGHVLLCFRCPAPPSKRGVRVVFMFVLPSPQLWYSLDSIIFLAEGLLLLPLLPLLYLSCPLSHRPPTCDKPPCFFFLLPVFVRYLPPNNSVEGVHLGDHLRRAQDAGRVPSVLLLYLHQLDDCYTLMMM